MKKVVSCHPVRYPVGMEHYQLNIHVSLVLSPEERLIKFLFSWSLTFSAVARNRF